MTKEDIKEILKHYRRMWDVKFKGVKLEVADEDFGVSIEFRVKNFFGVFNQKFMITEDMIDRMTAMEIREMMNVLEETLREAALYWFLSKRSPKDS